MPLIDITYFTQGNLLIPNTDSAEVLARVNQFIAKYEPEFLQNALGYPLYKAFIDGLATLPTIPQKWLDLKNGVEYTDSVGYLRKWRGLIESSLLQSMIANYVYYWYRRFNRSQFNGIGETVSKGNDSMVSPEQKMGDAWNEMSEWINELTYFLDSKYIQDATVYPEWIKQNRYYMQFKFKKINLIY